MPPGHPTQTRSINRFPEAALWYNIVPAPLEGEGQGEGGMIRPSFLIECSRQLYAPCVLNFEYSNLFRI